MSTTYKDAFGWLYRVSEAPDAKGEYRIEYLDPACSVVYKRLPGYNGSADRDEIVAGLDKLIKDRGLEAMAEDSPIPEWAVDIAKEFVASKWVRELEHFSAACFRASAEARAHRGGSCGPGFADASPKDIKLWRPGAGEVTYTWAKFVQVCKAMGIGPAPEEAPALKIKEKTMRKRNDRCPLQAECGRTCKVEGHERDCDYYVNNRVSCGGIPDQDALLDAEEREQERAWEAAQIAEDASRDYPDEVEPATAERPEIVDESSDQNTPPTTEPAAIAVPPAADIAAPGFDFGADEPTNTALLQCAQAFVAGRLAQVMAAKRAHELTANNKNGAFGKWCEAVGISRDTGNNLVNIADNFGNIELDGRPLVEITPISLLAIASKPSAPLELKQGVGSGDITTTKQYRELEAQLKATEAAKAEAERKVKGLETSYRTAHANEEYNIDLRKKATEEAEKAKAQLKAAEQAKEAAERETREALAWKQHAEGQAEDAKVAIHEAQQSAQEARRETEDLKQKLYRRNEELAKKEQVLNVTMDQQGMYIAKMQEQEDMLADLQDRLDDTTAQLRSRPVPAEVVDQDEVERRARELAAEKIAEALGAQERQPLCDLAMALNNAIRSAWDLSGLDGREPESEDDDTALEVLYETLCQIAAWAEGRIDLNGQEVATT